MLTRNSAAVATVAACCLGSAEASLRRPVSQPATGRVARARRDSVS